MARILYRLGDVNPIDYGGGVVFKEGDNVWIEYTYGYDTDAPHYDELEDDPPDVRWYHVMVDDVDWYDIKDLVEPARTAGISRDELEEWLSKNTIRNRVALTELYALHWGWAEAAAGIVESSPLRVIEKRWKV